MAQKTKQAKINVQDQLKKVEEQFETFQILNEEEKS